MFHSIKLSVWLVNGSWKFTDDTGECWFNDITLITDIGQVKWGKSGCCLFSFFRLDLIYMNAGCNTKTFASHTLFWIIFFYLGTQLFNIWGWQSGRKTKQVSPHGTWGQVCVHAWMRDNWCHLTYSRMGPSDKASGLVCVEEEGNCVRPVKWRAALASFLLNI